MQKINLNELARKVSENEGGKQQISIAQIKEVIRWTLFELGAQQNLGRADEVLKLCRKAFEKETK